MLTNWDIGSKQWGADATGVVLGARSGSHGGCRMQCLLAHADEWASRL
jgi:hypothetical protein